MKDEVPAVSEDKLLTDEERRAIRLAGELSTYITDHIIGHGANRAQDIAELESDIHHIQRRVMAQAAARAYPNELRLLGKSVEYRG